MIIINNGFNKFHLAPGAAELARREVLSAFATGAYPTARVRRWLNVLGLADNRKFALAGRMWRRLPRHHPAVYQEDMPSDSSGLAVSLTRVSGSSDARVRKGSKL